jgi:hypothetical protein
VEGVDLWDLFPWPQYRRTNEKKSMNYKEKVVTEDSEGIEKCVEKRRMKKMR